MQLFLSITLWLMIGSATAYFAHQRGRDPLIWFMLGMLLGFLGLLVLFLLPPIKEQMPQVDAEYARLERAPETHFGAAKDWFYYDDSRCRQGPVSYSQLKELMEHHVIKEDTYLWSEGMSGWKTAKEQFSETLLYNSPQSR